MATSFIRVRETASGALRFQAVYRVGGRSSALNSVGTYRDRADAEEALARVRARIAAGELGEAKPREKVYFAALGGLIKIGVSVAPERRVRALNARLVAVKSGGRQLERELHERFAHLRERGEWFRESPELHTYIHDEARAA